MKKNVDKAKTLQDFISITKISAQDDLLYLLVIGYKVAYALEKELKD